MLRVSLYIAFGSSLIVAAGGAQALGFGRVVNVSSLGQPLNFAATVRLDGDETLTSECVSVEVISGESKIPSAGIRVSVRPGADPSERLIRVSTVAQIEEPIVTVNVTAGCQPQLTRSFVTLVDPPVLNFARTQPEAPAAPSLPPVQPDSPVSAVVAAAQSTRPPEAAPVAAPKRATAPRPMPSRTAIASVPRQVRDLTEVPKPRPKRPVAAPPTRAAAVRPEAPVARLRLDAATGLRPTGKATAPAPAPVPTPVPTPAATAAAPTAAAAASPPPGAAAASAAAAAMPASAPVVSAISEAEQKRMALLEESLVRLRESNESTQKALASLQARLQSAESDRFTNPLVYGLAGLSALLALLVGFLWWRQSQTRGGSQWWIAPAGTSGPVPARPVAAQRPVKDGPSGAAKVETEPAVMDERSGAAVLEDMPPPRAITALPPKRQVPASMTIAPVAEPPPAVRRELSVEELIDLEQQAEFFVVLGQDEAAIDLLMGHVRSSGGVSPLPYLKLLEIYRRRGDREPYERIRERFNQRFNAYAPEWGTDLLLGKALDDYPQMLIKLQRFWDEPVRVTELLDGALMRTEGIASEAYDLPAYRELLFLYSIARDLAEHPETAGDSVDLLLPLESESGEEPIEHLTSSRLMGFAPTAQFSPTVDKPTPDFGATRPMADGDAKPSDFMGLINPPRIKPDPNRR